MPEHDSFLKTATFSPLNVRHMADSVEKLTMVTAGVVKQVRNEMAAKESPHVVVFVNGGRIQSIIADRLLEAYVVECEPPGEINGKETSAEICGLPVMVSKRDNTIAPRIVREVVRSHHSEGE